MLEEFRDFLMRGTLVDLAALEADRQTGGKITQTIEGEQDPRDERLARHRVVPDRERLSHSAEHDLLVSNESREAHRMDRRIRPHPR